MFTTEQEAEIQRRINTEVEGLKNKNTELLTALSENKKILEKIKGVDIEKLIKDSQDLSTLQQQLDKEKGEYKKLYENLTSAVEKEKTDLINRAKTAETGLAHYKKQTKISAAMAKIGVDPIMLDIAVESILPKAAIDDSDVIMVDGKGIDDFIKSWSESDVGKRFIVSGNSGGGAGGGGDMSPETAARFFDPKSKDYNLTEQAKIAKADIAMYNRLRKKFS